MRKLFISPHDDDNVLFGAFTCLREKPDVLIVLDSFIQPNRGEIGCDSKTRATETVQANNLLGCQVLRCSIPDDIATELQIEDTLKVFRDYDVIFAPALQGGNIHHDMVSRAADKVFGDKVIYYTTYTRSELWTSGETEVIPTENELKLKEQACLCYQSQLKLASTLPHFNAVLDKSEWIGQPQDVYLGAGKHHMEGWLHLDRHLFPNTDVVCDVTKGLPFKDSSIRRIYSQDFLEHLPPESKIFVMNEIWRVLKDGGTMEHYIPAAGSTNDFGSPTHLSHWSLQQFEHFDVDSYRYEKDRDYEGFKGAFRKLIAETVNNEQSIHVRYQCIK